MLSGRPEEGYALDCFQERKQSKVSQEPFVAALKERKEPRARQSRNAFYCESGETWWIRERRKELV